MNKGNIIFDTSLQFFSEWLVQNEYKHIFLLIDENTRKHCLPVLVSDVKILSDAQIIEIPTGEESKNLVNCEHIWSELLHNNANRDALIINLGGGLLTDIGGFAASVYKRGIPFVNIPTSLIGMIDASVGGKTGINFKSLKNQIGLFSDPDLVVICHRFLASLAQNHLLSGFGEMLKYGLILDRKLWNELKTIDIQSDLFTQTELINRCLEIKQSVVELDYYEKNYRKVLNFGHTVGHALESFFIGKSESELSHGQAVAHGLVIESIIANQCGLLSDSDTQEIEIVVFRHFQKLSLLPEYFDKLYEIMSFDKKNQNAVVNFTLLKSIGEAQIDNIVSKKGIIKALEEYMKL
ncbi:MAG: 3-dehydroquinate synthase [Bacteroidetes bacterium]|nr:3-dehydroquinate synthase [Bacteroidota bacterium]